MTLNAHFALKYVSGSATMSWRFWFSDKTVRKFEELPIHCQRQNCSQGNLVSSNVRFIWIFAGVCWRGASNDCGVVVNGDFRFFRSLYLPNLHTHGHNYYIVLCSPLVALHWHRNKWPWMTLNGHFAFKYGPSSASNGFAFWLSEKTARKFAKLLIDCQRQKMEPTHSTGDISVIHWCSSKMKRQTSELYSYSQFSHMLFTDIE